MAFFGLILALPLLLIALLCFLFAIAVSPLWLKVIGGFFMILFILEFLDDLRKRPVK